MVDQVVVERFLRQIAALVDEIADQGGIEIPPLRDPGHDLAAQRREQRSGFLALRRGHGGFGQHVHRRLVFLAIVEARHDAELVERTAEERLLGAQPHQAQEAQRLQPDLVAGRSQVIGGACRIQIRRSCRYRRRRACPWRGSPGSRRAIPAPGRGRARRRRCAAIRPLTRGSDRARSSAPSTSLRFRRGPASRPAKSCLRRAVGTARRRFPASGRCRRPRPERRA